MKKTVTTPGWYVDTTNDSVLRWWNGETWEEKVKTNPSGSSQKQFKKQRNLNLAFFFSLPALMVVVALVSGVGVLSGFG